MGPFALCGPGFLVLLVPLHGWSSKVFARLRRRTAEYTDVRVRIMSEVRELGTRRNAVPLQHFRDYTDSLILFFFALPQRS